MKILHWPTLKRPSPPEALALEIRTRGDSILLNVLVHLLHSVFHLHTKSLVVSLGCVSGMLHLPGIERIGLYRYQTQCMWPVFEKFPASEVFPDISLFVFWKSVVCNQIMTPWYNRHRVNLNTVDSLCDTHHWFWWFWGSKALDIQDEASCRLWRNLYHSMFLSIPSW